MVEVCRNGPPFHAPPGTLLRLAGRLATPGRIEDTIIALKKGARRKGFRVDKQLRLYGDGRRRGDTDGPYQLPRVRRRRSSLKGARDFWLSCGHHLLERDADGDLLVTDEFLKAYLARPEIVPPPEACSAERELHGALLLDPRRQVAPSRIAAIADADARENWMQMIAWRDQ